jgi:phosphoglycerol transferase
VTLIQLGLIGIDWFLKRFIQIDLEFVDYPGRPYGSLVSAFLLALAYFFLVASNWANQNFGLLTPEQIVYNLRQPMEGVDSNFISSFITGPLLGSLVLLVVLAVALVYLRRFAITCQLKKPLFKK